MDQEIPEITKVKKQPNRVVVNNFLCKENPLFPDLGEDELEESLVDGTDDLDFTPSTVSEDSGYSFPDDSRVTSSTDSGVMQPSVSRINSVQRHEGYKEFCSDMY